MRPKGCCFQKLIANGSKEGFVYGVFHGFVYDICTGAMLIFSASFQF